MPRPKVHPSQRQRAAEACNFCRASKKRCSATVPCTACQRRGIGDSCHLTHRPRGFRAAPLPLPHPPRTRASAPAPEQVPGSPSGGDCVPDVLLGDGASMNDSAWDREGFGQMDAPEWCSVNGGDADGSYRPLTPSDSRVSVPEGTASRSARQSARQSRARRSSPAPEPESHARMLLNLRGERGTSCCV